MDLTSLNTLLPASAGILFFIQSCYHLGLYRNLYLHSRKEKQETDTPPLSVILVAKDAASDLQKNLPAILEQDYPDFEVIVIYDQSSDDDCEDVLKLLEDKYPHLHHSFIPDSARYISHKKLGITMGIKASHHEWLVFTEPNCRPSSNQWLRKMARNFTNGTDIVLGYSNYEKTKGWFNRKVTFDTLLNAMRYLGKAVDGHPYTGCGRNLAYRKSLYYEQKGFTSHLNLQRGEDDLFINQVANRKNTRVEASPESIVRITAPHYQKDWHEDKVSYHLTSRLYKGFSRYLMGFETCTRLLFLLMVIVCIVYGILTQSWIVLGTAIMLWLLRYLMQVMVFRKTSIALGERKFYSTLLMLDWMQPLWNFRLKLSQRFSRKDEFMRR
ncbi:MAG: glycosyltransferase [Bacteroides sp.]|nr:glycosyltransferase [Bacteroides sp.]MBQ8874806.1 glycosyltransferase [Bacteroides sp.]